MRRLQRRLVEIQCYLGYFFRRLGRREMRTVKIAEIARTRPGMPGARGCIGSILLRPLSDGESTSPTIFTLRRFFALFPEKGQDWD